MKCPGITPTADQLDQLTQPSGDDAEAAMLTGEEHLAGLWNVLGLAVGA
jgi:hypothetical protein